MEAASPRDRMRRTRRGTVDRPLNARLVRAAALVVAPALLALLFSVSETGTLQRPQLDPLFDGEAAAAIATELSTVHPSRVPGTPQAEDAAVWYRETISGFGLVTEEDVWSAEIPDLGRVDLRNVVTVVPGRSENATIVVAHRDNAGGAGPFGDNASGTAVLIELARGFAPQEASPVPQRTLVLVSTDAGAYGGAGALRFAEQSPYADTADVAIVLDGVGGRGRPRLAVAGNGSSSAARRLVSTAAARIEEQAGVRPALPSILTQLVDLGIPYAAGEQGPLLERGIAAVTLTTDDPGDPGVPVGDAAGRVAAAKLGQLGRATEAIVGSVDTSVGTAFRTTDTLFLDDRAASGWTVRLTLVAAVAPFALGVLDLLVRNRRRNLPFAPALRAIRTRVFVWLFGGVLLWLGAIADVFPSGVAVPLPPYSSYVTDLPVAGIAVLAVAFVVGWIVARRRLVPLRHPTVEERLAGYTVALTWLALVAVVLALFRPFALVFVLPSLYAWLWLPLRTGPRARTALYGVGLLGPLAGVLVLSRELGLGLLDTLVYVAGLATVGYLPFTTALFVVAWGAAAGQLGALALGRYAPYAGGETPPPGPFANALARAAAAVRRRDYGRVR